MNSQLSLRGLTRIHQAGGAPALDRLDLDVPAGACVALLGPSGSGKTTTLRLVAGLDTPDSGDIIVNGVSVLAVAPERRGMAMVFQRPLLFPHLSILDNVAFAARVTGTPRRQARTDAARFLDLVQLPDFGKRRTTELSGGQEQRVALARALAARPRVLLLDEPFTALDASLRADMHELLIQLRTILEPTIVLVTHDPAEAALLADRVAVLSEGRLLQYDTARQLYTRPASLKVSRLMGGRNEILGTCVDRRHVSALGALSLPDDVVVPDGPAVLLVRHESVRLLDPADPAAHAHGVVAQTRLVGARHLVSVDVTGRPANPPPSAQQHSREVVRLHAETAPGQPMREGQQVGLRLPIADRTVVPAETDSRRP